MSRMPGMSAPAPEVQAPGGEPQSSWPMIIGIISIALGAIGILYYACNGGMTLAGDAMMQWVTDMVPPEQRDQMEAQYAAQSRYMVATVVAHLFGLVLAVLLLLVGIALVRRRPWSRRGAFIWSAGKIIHAFAAGMVGWLTLQATAEAMANNPEFQQAGVGGIMTGMGAVGIAFSILFFLAYPVFLLIWFNRTPVIREVSTWN